jgi:hypothetical protein
MSGGAVVSPGRLGLWRARSFQSCASCAQDQAYRFAMFFVEKWPHLGHKTWSLSCIFGGARGKGQQNQQDLRNVPQIRSPPPVPTENAIRRECP